MEIRRKVYAGEHFTSLQRKRWRQRLYKRSIKKRKDSIKCERLKTEMEEIKTEQRAIAEGMKQVADKLKELDAEDKKVTAESLILIKEDAAATAAAAKIRLLNRRMNEVMDELKRGINDFRTLFEVKNYLLLELPG